MLVHTTKDTDGIPAPALSIFPYHKNNSAFRLAPEEMEEMYESDLPCCDNYLTKKTFNQSDALDDIFLGYTRKMSILNQTDNLREEVTRPSYGRYYVFKHFYFEFGIWIDSTHHCQTLRHFIWIDST